MVKIENFYDLEAWKESHKLALITYKRLKSFPQIEKYGVADQLRRAVSSVGANIAEGFGRFHYGDKIKF